MVAALELRGAVAVTHVTEKTVEQRPGWFRVTLRARLLGMATRVTYETAGYDPPATITVITTDVTTRILRWLLASPERDTWTLTETGDGATRIERTVQLRHVLPGDTMLAGAQIRRQLRHVGNAIAG